LIHMALDTTPPTLRRLTPLARGPELALRGGAPPSESRTHSPGRDIAVHHAVGDKVAGCPNTPCLPRETKLGPPSENGVVPSGSGMASHPQSVRVGGCFLVGAGTVVTNDVPDFELVVGNPDRSIGSACRCGQCLTFTPHRAVRTCGHRFRRTDDQRIEEEEP
jgi:hypothetical protein